MTRYLNELEPLEKHKIIFRLQSHALANLQPWEALPLVAEEFDLVLPYEDRRRLLAEAIGFGI